MLTISSSKLIEFCLVSLFLDQTEFQHYSSSTISVSIITNIVTTAIAILVIIFVIKSNLDQFLLIYLPCLLTAFTAVNCVLTAFTITIATTKVLIIVAY